MKTAFALAFLAASAHAGVMGTVTAEWKTTKHLLENTLQICGTHTTAVLAEGVVTYEYSGATCTAGTTANELVWKTATGNAAKSPTALKAVCVMTAGKVVCTGTNADSMAITAGDLSCVNLLKCRPTATKALAATVKVTSNTDTVKAVASDVKFVNSALTKLVVVKPTAKEAKVGGAEFDLEFTFDANSADVVKDKVVSVVAPGYTQAKDGECKFGTKTAAAKASAPGVNGWSFTVVEGGNPGTDETKLVCTKVKVSATAEMAKDTFAVLWGDSNTAVTEGGFVESPAIAKADATTKAPTGSASTVSLSAAALLLAASMYF